jgi:hypothetical protein
MMHLGGWEDRYRKRRRFAYGLLAAILLALNLLGILVSTVPRDVAQEAIQLVLVLLILSGAGMFFVGVYVGFPGVGLVDSRAANVAMRRGCVWQLPGIGLAAVAFLIDHFLLPPVWPGYHPLP